MDRRQIEHIDGLLKDWARWELEGRGSPGLVNICQWHEGKPKQHRVGRRRRSEQERLGLPTRIPRGTPPVSSSRPLTARTYPTLERIRAAILKFDEEMQLVVYCLYLKRMTFNDVTRMYCVPSRYLGEVRHKIVKAIDLIV